MLKTNRLRQGSNPPVLYLEETKRKKSASATLRTDSFLLTFQLSSTAFVAAVGASIFVAAVTAARSRCPVRLPDAVPGSTLVADYHRVPSVRACVLDFADEAHGV